MTTIFWRRSLVLTSLLIAVYAVALVVTGPTAARLFDALGFGMSSGRIPDGAPHAYVLFIYGVLGSVLAAWMLTVAGIAACLLPRVGSEAWLVLVLPVLSWFVMDTGFSLVVGSWPHAAFNVIFLAALGIPLLGWRRAHRRKQPPALNPYRRGKRVQGS